MGRSYIHGEKTFCYLINDPAPFATCDFATCREEGGVAAVCQY